MLFIMCILVAIIIPEYRLHILILFSAILIPIILHILKEVI